MSYPPFTKPGSPALQVVFVTLYTGFSHNLTHCLGFLFLNNILHSVYQMLEMARQHLYTYTHMYGAESAIVYG